MLPSLRGSKVSRGAWVFEEIRRYAVAYIHRSYTGSIGTPLVLYMFSLRRSVALSDRVSANPRPDRVVARQGEQHRFVVHSCLPVVSSNHVNDPEPSEARLGGRRARHARPRASSSTSTASAAQGAREVSPSLPVYPSLCPSLSLSLSLSISLSISLIPPPPKPSS